MSAVDRGPRITVLAGVNGAGKSSLLGALLRERKQDYYNPDEETARILAAHPQLAREQANALAWHLGREALERAITERRAYAFETTLAGRTIPALLHDAAAAGLEVFIWYVGLDGPERHVARVRSRVSRGGHSIPDETIRDRYDRSRDNLIELMPVLSALSLFDNTLEADPFEGKQPNPRLLLFFESRRIVRPDRETLATSTPAWARSIVATALRLALTPHAGG